MKKIILLISFIIINATLNGILITIDINGTQDYTSIQEAINNASDGDSLIVYPGIYYENIDFHSKSITLASTYIFTNNSSIIDNTIIDGNHSGRCVLVDSCEDAVVSGFTLKNGYLNDYYRGGGGLYVVDSGIRLEYCKITKNFANYGGGVYTRDSDTELIGNTISYNHASDGGGGLHSANDMNDVIFSIDEPNNIYLNYSCTGSDLSFSSVNNYVFIYIDTLTVINFTNFHITFPETYDIFVTSPKIEEINHNLYVSPDGSDENSGLAPDEPLQTIAWAQTLIKPDSLNPNTIYLSEGVYSRSGNNQAFPLNYKNHTEIHGSLDGNSILDAENQTNIIQSSTKREIKLINLKNLTLINGATPYLNASGISLKTIYSELYMENCIVSDCDADDRVIEGGEGIFSFKNCIFKDNTGSKVMDISPETSLGRGIDLTIENCTFENNNAYHGDGYGDGGAIGFWGHYSGVGEYNCSIVNSQFTRNRNIFNGGNQGGVVGVHISRYVDAEIINCTFIDNQINYPNGSCILAADNSEISIYNSIIYDNDYRTLIIYDDDCTINVYNSLLEGGDDNVYYHENGTMNWIGDNLFYDPFYIESGLNEYHLLSNSPCIDAGTMDLPEEVELPNIDLAGNPRIYGDNIDMGCYEWQGTDNTNDELPITNYELSNYPNPFNPVTYVEFSILEDSEVLLSIYNIKGQFVKTLIDSNIKKGKHQVIWNGKNEFGQSVSSGIYYCRLKSDNLETFRKMILIK